MKIVVILLVALTVLTGCSVEPSESEASDAAIAACTDAISAGLDPGGMDIGDYAQSLVVIRFGCEKLSAFEPGPFRERYGD